MEILILVAFVGSAISASLLFCLIYFNTLQSRLDAIESLAIEAKIGAESLNKSTVIQRIVEKYHVVKPDESISESVKNAEREMEDTIFGPRSPEELRREAEQAIRNAVLNAEDLV